MLNLYNTLTNSHHLRRVAKLLVKNQLLILNHISVKKDLNFYYID